MTSTEIAASMEALKDGYQGDLGNVKFVNEEMNKNF